MSITIPTTELIGGLTDVLPQVSDPKGALAGVEIAWDGDALHFTTYDTYSGATVQWVPGEGAEGTVEGEGDTEGGDIEWGGDDSPWRVWIWLPQAKEILKLFKLPAKLWRFPVTLKTGISQDRLIIERTDGPKGERLLTLPTSNDMLNKIPNVRQVAEKVDSDFTAPRNDVGFAGPRLGAFGTVRWHGAMVLRFGAEIDPVAIEAGTRFAGFIYPQGVDARRFDSGFRGGSGVQFGGMTGGGKTDAGAFDA